MQIALYLHMSRILGIDYGSKYIGFAISDETHNFAAEEPHIFVGRDKSPAAAAIEHIKNNFADLGLIVIGHPLGLEGKPTQISQLVDKFAAELEQVLNIPVKLWNETGTSQQAASTDQRSIHSRSAQIILQEYLDFLRTGI